MERMSITTTQAALDKLLGGMTRYGSEVWESADGRLMIAKGFDGLGGHRQPGRRRRQDRAGLQHR